MTSTSDNAGGVLVVLTSDQIVLRRLDALAVDLDLRLEFAGSVADLPNDAPLAMLFDLEHEGVDAAITGIKARWPATLVAGFVAQPDRARWEAAEAAGCDLVATRGALRKQLAQKIGAWRSQPGGPRIPLFPLGDIAGRLGLVKRLPETPLGPVAIYHIGGEILAIRDMCPHAGSPLAEGELDMDQAIVTCPEHGSRFDVRSGERLRGPADTEVATYRVVVEDARAYLRLD